MSSPRVTLHELQTVYSLEDLYDLIEVGAVRSHNEWRDMRRLEEQERQRGS